MIEVSWFLSAAAGNLIRPEEACLNVPLKSRLPGRNAGFLLPYAQVLKAYGCELS